MNLTEYASHDALGLAAVIAKGDVSPREVAATAMRAIEAANPAVNAVVETYPDRIEDLDEATLGDGPFRGVPFLIKDVFGHDKGRTIEFGSRLCKGMKVDATAHLATLFHASGLNILGRCPEEVRLPLLPVTKPVGDQIRAAMVRAEGWRVSSVSQKMGTAPSSMMPRTVPESVLGVVMTSSPGPMPAAIRPSTSRFLIAVRCASFRPYFLQ